LLNELCISKVLIESVSVGGINLKVLNFENVYQGFQTDRRQGYRLISAVSHIWLANAAAALYGIAACYHARGHLAQAKDYYEKASALAERSLEKDAFGSNGAAATAEEVIVRAEAGLGQAAAHLG
jgi:tetratricopeptide (TPR) repeat protein